MDSSKLSALLFIFMLSLSTIPQTLACDYCPKNTPPKKSPPPKSPASPTPKSPASPTPKSPATPTTPGGLPIPLPPLPNLPPLPKLPLPPLPSLPPLPKLPPLPSLPPVGLPTLPIGGQGSPPSPPGKSSCPTPTPPATTESCPIDALKLGACVDVLGNTIHIGDPTVECCPVIDGLVGVAAAACLCTALKAKLLDIGLYLPIALQVLVACGASVPAGYTCA